MATLREERARLQFLEEHGHGDEKVHVVFIEEEAKKRIENKKERTRLIRELDTPQTYADFNAEFDRFIRCAGNVQVAYSLMLRCLAQWSEKDIQKLAEDQPAQIPAGEI